MPWSELYKKYQKIAKIWTPVALFVSILKAVFVELPTIGHKIPLGEATMMVVVLTLRIIGIMLMSVYAGGPGGMIFQKPAQAENKLLWRKKHYLTAFLFFVVALVVSHRYPYVGGVFTVFALVFLVTLILAGVVDGVMAAVRKFKALP
jgi:hypothetical protein